MTDTTPTKTKFKKRKKKNKNRNIRESITSIEPTTTTNPTNTQPELETKQDLNSDDDLSFLTKLQEAKSIHKLQFQCKNKGLVFEETHEFTNSGLENPDTFKHDPSKDFGESFSTEKIQDDKLKLQREEWIEKKLREKLLEQGRILPENKNKKEENNIGNKTSLKEELYALPNKLCAPLFSNKDNNEAGERWLAGMSEYELPLDFKLKNIKQTEDAKKKLLEPKEKKDKIFDIPRNYNQDFTTHHFDRVKMAEHKRKLQESQQKVQMERDKKRRRLMGTQWYNNNGNVGGL